MTTIGEKYIFFHMPRTGGTSVTKWIFEKNLGHEILHGEINLRKERQMFTTVPHAGPVHLYQALFLDKSRFWFSFIRNPFDWYVSKWAMKFALAENYSNFKDWIYPLLTESDLRSVSKWVSLNMRFMPNIFPGGVENWNGIIDEEITPDWNFEKELNPPDIKFDVGYMTHRYLQVCCGYPLVYFEKFPNWIHRHDELCLMNEVYKFEDGIENALSDVFKMEIENFPKINTSEHKSYREYYDDELVELVLYKDRFIFEEYGYTF